MPVWAYIPPIARQPTNADAFNAIAEPRRREILDCLRNRERGVMELVTELGWPQALVSKHLRVLRDVGLVHVHASGRTRIYRVNAEELKAIHEWVTSYEKLWDHQLDRIKQRAEQAARSSQPKR